MLLGELITVHDISRETLAEALGVSKSVIDEHVSGTKPMSLETQAGLATFIIERVPSLRRIGHRLRAQTEAASDFHKGITETHVGSRPGS